MQIEILKNLPAILMHSELQKPRGDCGRIFFMPHPYPSPYYKWKAKLKAGAGIKSS